MSVALKNGSDSKENGGERQLEWWVERAVWFAMFYKQGKGNENEVKAA
jgi:hypothetical protein